MWWWVLRLHSIAAAKSLQSCPTLCNPIDGSPPGSPIPGILQARTLEWVAISFSNAWKWKVKVKSLSHVRLLATPWTAVHQAPPSMGFSRQEYWSGVPSPSPRGSLTNPNYLLFIVCIQCEEWLLKNKFFFSSNTHPCFWCHCIWHHSNRIKLSDNSNLKEDWNKIHAKYFWATLLVLNIH